MATFSNMNEGYYDNPTSRSPRSYRNHQPQMNRANSRPMDSAYGSMQGAMYANNNSYNNNNNTAQSLRYGGGPFAPPMQNGMQNGMGNAHFPYDSAAAQTWNAGSNGIPSFNVGLQDPSRSVRPSRGRGPVSNLWDDSAYPPQQPASQLGRQPSLTGRQELPDDDELIPTAIVIKNIPFAVKKEQLVELMVNMNLPLPYAFNYHFDNGVFRGLAFANFTSPNETEQVIQALNHMELSGRKLRVEYKKMLPLAERERIEREKRERRGQLEEQHRPLPSDRLHTQVSMSALSQARNTPSPLSHRQSARPSADIDMNDPVTLEFYTQLTLFKLNAEPETLIFPQDLPPENRRLVHTLAHHMGLLHTSHGMGEQRQVHVQRAAAGSNVSPPNPSVNARQGLVRTTTTDYGEGRPYDGPSYTSLRGQASVGLLDARGDTNAFGRQDNSNLRNAKSYADLRTWSPSPVPSAASFPAALQTNGSRLQAIGDTAGSNTPTLTPVASNPTMGNGRDEPFLISGFNNLGIGNGSSSQTSPRRQRSTFFNSTSTWEDQPSYQATAPIGSKRTVSIGPDSSAPLRQSRGPGSTNAMGFRRHNGRGSDELRNAASAIAE
ncbi:Peptidyl-prolyl cis-trans isomerase pin4 [Knufia fluminis]|uniref:Peptidyl-prolyl cis-trans isomerase pin4 n=1 Tax=Knufia fluminis TaxID=191047 RepID=A0AAN8I1R7_9EURO|nr:Peptidyl-prolyl cis-trans isomerase pin4 [Knufia fluminis]